MNVIDLQILIPASPEFIWRFLGDLSAIPSWQDDVASVSFLSTQRDGQGTRWRNSPEKGNDVVVEISAWYDTLGYEYRIVDGAKFGENQGRIRLQEVAEGTLVRWIFQYELNGVFGGLRNAMRLKRNTSNRIQAYLRNLHHLITTESGGISTHEAKAIMREAPDVEERSAYRPRHPSSFEQAHLAEFEESEDDFATDQQPVSFEFDAAFAAVPESAETDTKPNPVMLAGDLDSDITTAVEDEQDDTKPVEVDSILAALAAAAPQPDYPALDPIDPETAPTPETLAPPEPDPTVEPVEPVEPEPEYQPLARRETRDRSELSVFDIFGLQKPSEARLSPEPPRERSAQDAKLDDQPAFERWTSFAAQSTDLGEETDLTPEPSASPDGKIAGLRRSQRRRMPRVRSHTS